LLLARPTELPSKRNLREFQIRAKRNEHEAER
jgi:hypothetical protein